jgi:hypothetical protein
MTATVLSEDEVIASLHQLKTLCLVSEEGDSRWRLVSRRG